MKDMKILSYLFYLIAILTIGTSIYIGIEEYEKLEEVSYVPCYDKFSNEIKDQVCIDEPNYTSLIILIGMSVILIHIGIHISDMDMSCGGYF